MNIFNSIIRAIRNHGGETPLQAIADRTNSHPEDIAPHVDHLIMTGHVKGLDASPGVPPSTFGLTPLGMAHADTDDGTDAFLASSLLAGPDFAGEPEDHTEPSGEVSSEGAGGEFGGGGAGGEFEPSTDSDSGSSDDSSSAIPLEIHLQLTK